MIIIALNGTISDILQSPTRTLKWPGCNRVQIMCNPSGAQHLQHVVCHVIRRDSSGIKFDKSLRMKDSHCRTNHYISGMIQLS